MYIYIKLYVRLTGFLPLTTCDEFFVIRSFLFVIRRFVVNKNQRKNHSKDEELLL